MERKKWTKKDKIACITIFSICIITAVVFLSTMTLSYFFDTHSASQVITAGSVSIKVTGGNSAGYIEFSDTLTPNTQYKVTDNTKLNIQNTSTSGAVFLMVKITSDYSRLIRPMLQATSWETGKYWVVGTNMDYFYYMSPLDTNYSCDLCDGWQVGNITNAISGSSVEYKITVYAVQYQGGAVTSLINSNTDGWQYAPQIFKDMVSNY